MNPTRDAAIWLRSLVLDAPEAIQGAAILLGICLPFIAIALFALVVGKAVERKEEIWCLTKHSLACCKKLIRSRWAHSR